MPPTTKPLAPAAAPDALQPAIARSRCGPSGVIVVSSRNADGTDRAAAAPCRHLAAVSTTADVAVAPTTAATAKIARPVKMMRR